MRWFNRNALLGAILALAVCHALPQRGTADTFTVTVLPSISPNPFGSPSFAGYANNAITALVNGQTSAGTPGTPAYYSVLPMSGSNYTTTTASIIATGFNSWNGQANPVGAFASELGNFLNFGVVVTRNNATTPPTDTFTLAGVSINIMDTNGNANDNLGYSDDLSGTSFGTDSIGTIKYGWDGTGGLSPNIMSGDDTTPTNALWYTGFATAYQVLSTDPGATDQEKINNLLTQLIADGAPFTVTATYTVVDSNGDISTGSATVVVTPASPFAEVPEPTSLGLWGCTAGLAGLVVRLRRRARRQA